MTHFVTAVIAPATLANHFVTRPTDYPGLYGEDALEVEPTKSLYEYLSRVLARYDENREVQPYISKTKEQQIADERQRHADAAENLRKYRSGEPPYDRPILNPRHLEWIWTEAPALAKLNDEELWDHLLKLGYEERDKNGAIWSTYNPDSKWDWWVIGGRWEDTYRNRQSETVANLLENFYNTRDGLQSGEEMNPHKGEPLAHGGDLPWYFPHNLLTSDGAWHEIGATGWFGFRDDSMSELEWVTYAIEKLENENPNNVVYYLDLHI